MLVTSIGLLVVVASSVYIAWPLLTEVHEEPTEVGVSNSLEREKETALAAIGEIDFDHRVGKISDQDHQMLRAQLEARALRALAALDREGSDDDTAPVARDSRPTLEPTSTAAAPGFCPSCGHALIQSPNFCAACGEKISSPDRA